MSRPCRSVFARFCRIWAQKWCKMWICTVSTKTGTFWRCKLRCNFAVALPTQSHGHLYYYIAMCVKFYNLIYTFSIGRKHFAYCLCMPYGNILVMVKRWWNFTVAWSIWKLQWWRRKLWWVNRARPSFFVIGPLGLILACH